MSDNTNEEVEKRGADLKEISMEEVQKHTDPESLWLVVGNRVLDVSQFDDHPGK